MRTIAFHIQKGGSGKSSLSGNVAYGLSERANTIMVDCDPQGNLSSWFLTEAPSHELCDVLTGKVETREAVVQIKDKLSIIPTFAIGGNLKNYAESKLVDEPFIFEDLGESLKELGFEYCIFDLSPGMSRLEKSVLLACDEVITPLTPEYFSLDGIEIFSDHLQKINKGYRKSIQHSKIVINMMNRSFKRHNLIHGRIINGNAYDFFTVGQDSKIAEAQLHNKTIFEYYKKSKAINDLNKLIAAL